MEEKKQDLYCDTCGKETEHLHRDVLDDDYNAFMKPPLWNCEACYEKKRAQRLSKGRQA
ncbi:MAG: hypothetical protein O2954_15360 [bacterium]|nr:hypothetical protein [bacterium]